MAKTLRLRNKILFSASQKGSLNIIHTGICLADNGHLTSFANGTRRRSFDFYVCPRNILKVFRKSKETQKMSFYNIRMARKIHRRDYGQIGAKTTKKWKRIAKLSATLSNIKMASSSSPI